MQSLIKFSLKQTVFINVVFVILVLAGLFSLFTLPLENMPSVDVGRIFIQTFYFGASAEDVEHLVTTKIEKALDGLENVEYIQSNSSRNISSITVKLIDDSDYDALFDELRFRVLNIMDELPAGIDNPLFTYIDTNVTIPAIVINLAGEIPHRSLKLLADLLKSKILPIPGVRNVLVEGNFEQQYHVTLDPTRLRRWGITFQDVVQAIRSANTKLPSGRFRKFDSQYVLNAGRRLASQKEVLEIVVRRDGDGNYIRVADLATSTRLSYRDPNAIPSINGENAIQLLVEKENDGNAVYISRQANKIAEEFMRLHEQDGIKIVCTNDSAIEIKDNVNALKGNLILGMILVTGLLWFLLGFRNALVTAVGIPFAFLCAFIIMKITGTSLNTLSLFAFVLVTGIMVDDAVVIMENIFRHLQMGKPKKEAIIEGGAEVLLPVISSALTTLMAFLPMLIMTGSSGEFLSHIPKTVSYALVVSLLEAMFILPVHYLDWGPKKAPRPAGDSSSKTSYYHIQTGPFARLWEAYYWIVTKILNHKAVSFSIITIVFICALLILILSMLGIAPLIKVEFFPDYYFRYHVNVAMPTDTAIEQTDSVVRDISRYIMSLGKGQALSAAGSAGYYIDANLLRNSGSNYGDIIVSLPKDTQWNFPDNPKNDPLLHLDVMRRKITDYLKEKYETAGKPKPSIKIFAERSGPPQGKKVNIRVSGFTLEGAIKASDAILEYLRNDKEMADLIDLESNKPDFHQALFFNPRQEKISEYQLRPGDVTTLVTGILNGMPAGTFRLAGEEIDLIVRIAQAGDEFNNNGAAIADPKEILNLPFLESSTSPVLLDDLVEMTYGVEPSIRSRYNGNPTITITADIRRGSQLSPARVQVKASRFFRFIEKQFPGVFISFGGEFETTRRSFESLGYAFIIALLGIYMILATQFRDYFQPIIIITSVPYAIIGVVIGLFLSRTTFTITSFMAIIGLAGIAVNDSLLLIDFINVRRRQGKPMREAIIESCAYRMRPVLITTITTILGLLPMAIGIPSRSLTWAPMATTFVAGLTSATILVLIITPANYEFVENLRATFKNRLKARTDESDNDE